MFNKIKDIESSEKKINSFTNCLILCLALPCIIFFKFNEFSIFSSIKIEHLMAVCYQ